MTISSEIKKVQPVLEMISNLSTNAEIAEASNPGLQHSTLLGLVPVD
jgi:hypothetical protein